MTAQHIESQHPRNLDGTWAPKGQSEKIGGTDALMSDLTELAKFTPKVGDHVYFTDENGEEGAGQVIGLRDNRIIVQVPGGTAYRAWAEDVSEALHSPSRATDRAMRSLQKWEGCDEDPEEIETHMRDVLTDLRHLADARGVDFNDLLDRSYNTYSDERADPYM